MTRFLLSLGAWVYPLPVRLRVLGVGVRLYIYVINGL